MRCCSSSDFEGTSHSSCCVFAESWAASIFSDWLWWTIANCGEQFSCAIFRALVVLAVDCRAREGTARGTKAGLEEARTFYVFD